jgi:butyrate kinase
MDKNYKLFAINSGSTSMKAALFENEKELFSLKTTIDPAQLNAFRDMGEALSFFKNALLAELDKKNISLKDTDAFIGRCLGIVPCEAGTYDINETMLNKVRSFPGIQPHFIAMNLAHEFAATYGGMALGVDPEDIDELEVVARVTGLANVEREARYHPLNQKAVARRYAADTGSRYEDLNLVVAHMGGGISISAHKKGRIIDTTDATQGDGPMAPNRPGAIPVTPIVSLCFSGEYTQKEMNDLVRKGGGLMSHLGTDDLRQVVKRIAQGDTYARIIFDAMIYQIGKNIAAQAAVLKGKVDAILLTGGMSHNAELVQGVTDMVQFLAPVKVYAGEFELEAMAVGALRVLTGQEQVKTYTGVPVWSGFKRYTKT